MLGSLLSDLAASAPFSALRGTADIIASAAGDVTSGFGAIMGAMGPSGASGASPSGGASSAGGRGSGSALGEDEEMTSSSSSQPLGLEQAQHVDGEEGSISGREMQAGAGEEDDVSDRRDI